MEEVRRSRCEEAIRFLTQSRFHSGIVCRYAVDKDDQASSSNADEEVWELVPNERESTAASRRNALSGQDARAEASESSSDTDDEIER